MQLMAIFRMSSDPRDYALKNQIMAKINKIIANKSFGVAGQLNDWEKYLTRFLMSLGSH